MFPPVALYIFTLTPFISRLILPAGKIHRALGGRGGELFRVVSGVFGKFFGCFWCPRSRSPGPGARKLTITFSFGVFQIYWVSGEPFMVLFGTANLIYKLSGVRESSLQRFRAPRIPSKGFWAPRVSFSAPSIA